MRDPGPFGLLLLGWDDRSIYGWDEGTGSWYAQLWRNDEPDDPIDDAPHVGIGPLYGHRVGSITELSGRIAAATGYQPDFVDALILECSQA
jgi:hypothetical protein